MIDIAMPNVSISENVSSFGKSIDDLPNEILARIFWYIHPIKDTLPILAFVCRKWREILSNNSSLWRVIHVDPKHYAYWHFSLICSLFQLYGHHIQRLTWTDHSPVYENVFVFIPHLRNLRYLRLPILWTRTVVRTLASLHELESIQINGGFAFTDDELALVAKHFPNLTDISLNACWRITANGIASLIENLKGLQTLKLKINSGLRLTDPRSVQAIRRGYAITKRIIDNDNFGLVQVLCLHFIPVEMEELWHLVKKLTLLTKLNISNCEVSSTKVFPRLHRFC